MKFTSGIRVRDPVTRITKLLKMSPGFQLNRIEHAAGNNVGQRRLSRRIQPRAPGLAIMATLNLRRRDLPSAFGYCRRECQSTRLYGKQWRSYSCRVRYDDAVFHVSKISRMDSRLLPPCREGSAYSSSLRASKFCVWRFSGRGTV